MRVSITLTVEDEGPNTLRGGDPNDNCEFFLTFTITNLFSDVAYFTFNN